MTHGDGKGQSSDPQRRFILLGASNIARSFSTVVSTCQQVCGQPVDLMTASGHGRGYGLESWVLGRSLPSILECGLWDALATRPPLQTVSLLTDIGNDLVFGASPEQVASWVEQCLRRLARLSNRIIVTELPLASLVKLGAVRFRIMRTLLFPRSVLTAGVAAQHARELNERVVELATQYDAQRVCPAAQWYGVDPIHVKRAYQTRAWQTILSVGQPSAAANAVSSFFPARSLCCLRPQHRRLFGIKQSRRQPCATLINGTSISLY